MMPLALVIFAVISAGRLRALAGSRRSRAAAALTLSWYVVWGFYQEVMYRGILQTELVRRWGVVPGILVSNTAYTFGPLHVYYWTDVPGVADAGRCSASSSRSDCSSRCCFTAPAICGCRPSCTG